MFNHERVIKKLSSDKLGKEKTMEILEDVIPSKDFAEFLWKPKGISNLAEVVEQLFAAFCRPQVIKCLTNYIIDEGYEEFNRTQAAFFYSICTSALESNNQRAEENSAKRKEGQITNREFNETNDKIDAYAKSVKKLFKATKKIVKRQAVTLSEDTRVPVKICRIACYMVPEANEFDRNKISPLLDNLLTEMYDLIAKENIEIPDNANWKGFFRKLFGKDNLAEVATFLLLEGHNRRDPYKSDHNVITAWDSLTEFALMQMNQAPETLRDQMLELYIKKISRLFTNGAYELRVNLLDIPEVKSKWPQLANSIGKYANKIREIVK